MSKKKNPAPAIGGAELQMMTARELAAQTSSVEPVKVSLRLSAGKHAVSAPEAEVHVDGVRIAGGEGIFEFDLFVETWVEIHIIRPLTSGELA
jgi:hypothetical protein